MKNLEKDKQSKHDDGYFDNCPICQAMKKAGIKMQRYDDSSSNDGVWEGGFSAAKVNLKELKEAFKKARDQGAIVGGEWFEGGEEGE